MNLERDAQAIFEASIQAVLPDAAVRRALVDWMPQGPVHVVAIGKAAWRMASAAVESLGDVVRAGVVITKYGHSLGEIPRMEIIEAGHPVPDENALFGARKALALVDGLTARDYVLFLVSGGGSALFELPLPGVSLEDISALTKALLASGADIAEINTVRKHLSAVKGGRFAQRCHPARVRSVVLSDVLGDALDSIASGPAYPDSTTVEEAQAVLRRYGIVIPPHMQAVLRQETPKGLEHVETQITGNVSALCSAAMDAARARGYAPLLMTTTLDAEAREAGACIAAMAREVRRSGHPIAPPCALVFGGETVVHLRGQGKGGRNQELALAAARGIEGLKDVLVFSIGSDGTDGPTDAAGGMVTGEFAARCRAAGCSIEAHLAENDAYPLLQAMGGLIVTGPTGTNVNDLTVVLCG